MKTSFKVIPLNNVFTNRQNCVEFIKNMRYHVNPNLEWFDDTHYIRGIYSNSFTSDIIIPSSMYNVKMPWYMNTKHSVYTHITYGKQFIETYNPATKEKSSIIMTSKHAHVNGEKIDSPSMLMLSPGLFYRFIIGNKGASSIVVNTINNEIHSENKNENINENENELKVVGLCEDTGKSIELDEYHDNKVENTNPVHWKKLVHKWNKSAWII